MSPMKHFDNDKRSQSYVMPEPVSQPQKTSFKRVGSFTSLEANSITLSQEAEKVIESEVHIKAEDQFCFQYYHKKYRDLRLKVIKDLFRKLTSRWRELFVIYPLGSTAEINHCISRFYYITYEIDSPIMLRYEHFKMKYPAQSHYTLEQFVQLDDLIKFNNMAFQTVSMDPKYQTKIKHRFYNRTNEKEDFFKELKLY